MTIRAINGTILTVDGKVADQEDCCNHCWYRWESEWDCDSSSWGTVTNPETKCVRCSDTEPTPQSWQMKSGSDCVAERWTRECEHCCSPSGGSCSASNVTTPSAPTLDEPEDCCVDCSDCGGSCDDLGGDGSSLLVSVPSLYDSGGNQHPAEDIEASWDELTNDTCPDAGWLGASNNFLADLRWDDNKGCYILNIQDFLNFQVVWRGCKGGTSPLGTYQKDPDFTNYNTGVGEVEVS